MGGLGSSVLVIVMTSWFEEHTIMFHKKKIALPTNNGKAGTMTVAKVF